MEDRVASRLSRLAPVLLAGLIVVVYLPSLGGGFLMWDDRWLIEHNPVFTVGSTKTLVAIWTDSSLGTRLTFGAEYLPIRDTFLFLEARLLGLHPLPLRLVQLGLYVAAALCFRGALLRSVRHAAAAEAAAWIFALHPAHVESVAWMSGQKDVLALLFVGAACLVHAGTSARRMWFVPLLLACAHLSKSMTVIAGGLLVAEDLLARRRLDPKLYALVAMVAALATLVHVRIGSVVHMVGAPAGGNRIAALMTMGSVWLRYLWVSVWPGALSLVHDVPVRTTLDPASLAGYLVVVAWGVGGLLLLVRRSSPLLLSTWLWFWLPLLPVSQILFPLQNAMADRYLLLSVMAVGLAIGGIVQRTEVAGKIVAAVAILTFAGASAQRSALFSSNLAVFGDAMLKTHESPIAPYQFGKALEWAGDLAGARAAYEEVLRRSPGASDPSRRATNNLAKIYAGEGRYADAERLLERGLGLWPNDRKMWRNLLIVLARQGKMDAARKIGDRLARIPETYELPE